MASWLFLLGMACKRMQIEIGTEQLHLTASLYEWFLFNPWGVRQVRLRWDEIEGLRLWPIPNFLAPGGVQQNYVLYTTHGNFVLSNVVWPHPEHIAAAISERTGLAAVRSVADLPPKLASAAQPSRKEKFGLLLLRRLAWTAIILGWFVVIAVVLCFLTGQEWQGSIRQAVIAALILVCGGHALLRFRFDRNRQDDR